MTGFLQPGLMGLMTRRVDPRHQGQLQGANQMLQGIASIVGPPLFGLTFAWAVRHDAALHLPGLPILVSAVSAGRLVPAFPACSGPAPLPVAA